MDRALPRDAQGPGLQDRPSAADLHGRHPALVHSDLRPLTTPVVCWVDGELVPLAARALRADDTAFAQGLGCYTTARVRSGEPRLASRHAARLARDALRLGLGTLDPRAVERALAEVARAVFPATDGVVRVQASRDGDGALHLTAVPRATGDEPDAWRACTAPFPHEGPMPWSGAKVTNHLLFALAAADARTRGADEALFFDRDGYLVEGARANVVVVGEDGRPSTPDLARGGVAGIAREILLERVPELAVRNVSAGDVSRASEIVAINAVRGARPCVSLDGAPVGDGAPGPWAARLDALLA